MTLAALAAGESRAGALRYCDQPEPPTAVQRDRLLRFAAVIKTELDASGRSLALISRSGLDLSRFGVRYSHAGFGLKASANAPWSVRQLYFACDEGKPRIFDQGISGFLLGTDNLALGYISVVLLPAADAAAVERDALDNRQAVKLLGASYSANAYAYASVYQNCNQWVMEMLAVAWGGLQDNDGLRDRAQLWLYEQAYAPSDIEVGNRALMLLGAFSPWLHGDDHPSGDIDRMIYSVSMPASIEAFVRGRVAGATRIEFCHTKRHMVVHRGWEPLAEGCQPGAQDRVVALD